MAHSLTHIYVHLVFATKHRQLLIEEGFRVHVEKFMSGIYKNTGQILMAQYAMPDHYHGLFRLNPSQSLASFIRILKSATTHLINAEYLPGNFAWQNGYGAFSHISGDLEGVTHYILTQPEHHATRTLMDEVIQINRRYHTEWSLDD